MNDDTTMAPAMDPTVAPAAPAEETQAPTVPDEGSEEAPAEEAVAPVAE